MRLWLLVFCLLFSACRPTAGETSGGGPAGVKAESIQALYFIYSAKGACPASELTTALGSLRLYATRYSENIAVAPGRIGELRLPAHIARGGNDSVRFVDGGRLISFDPVHRTLRSLSRAADDQAVDRRRLSRDRGGRYFSVADERSFGGDRRNDPSKIASDIDAR